MYEYITRTHNNFKKVQFLERRGINCSDNSNDWTVSEITCLDNPDCSKSPDINCKKQNPLHGQSLKINYVRPVSYDGESPKSLVRTIPAVRKNRTSKLKPFQLSPPSHKKKTVSKINCLNISNIIARTPGAFARPLVYSTFAHCQLPAEQINQHCGLGSPHRLCRSSLLFDAFMRVCLTATQAFAPRSALCLDRSSASETKRTPTSS